MCCKHNYKNILQTLSTQQQIKAVLQSAISFAVKQSIHVEKVVKMSFPERKVKTAVEKKNMLTSTLDSLASSAVLHET